MCELDGYAYAVGGWLGPNSVTRSVERYSPALNMWENIASTEIGLHEHAGIRIYNLLYKFDNH